MIRPHSMVVGSGCILSLCGRVLCMVLVHLQPVVFVIVCHAIATDGGVGGVLDHGLCHAWIHVSASVLLGLVVWKPLCLDPSDGVFEWSVRPSSPLRLPHLKICYVMSCHVLHLIRSCP